MKFRNNLTMPIVEPPKLSRFTVSVKTVTKDVELLVDAVAGLKIVFVLFINRCIVTVSIVTL